MMPDRLVVFTRYPEPGRTKTRLIGRLGAPGAAQLQRAMTAHTLRTAEGLAEGRPVAVEVRFDGGDGPAMRALFGEGPDYRPQGEGDLGRRLDRAVADALTEGAASVVVIGSDCPGITAGLLGRAFDRLAEDARRVVLGPATDGGYYLIGLARPEPGVFLGIDWGTDVVLGQTEAAARAAGRPIERLGVLADVDRPEDLGAWYAVAGRPTPPISVVIPARNEEASIARAIASAALPGSEVIVVDGGSRDRTAEVARLAGAQVIEAPAGRAVQMNAGAARAAGEVLVFLHADTTLPPGYDRLVAEALGRPGVVAGAFGLAIDGRGRALRLVERMVRWRSRRLQRPYGDQAIFLPATTFGELGGYPAIPIMEDVELVRRLRARGRIAILDEPVRTSARRWVERGVGTMTLVNQLCLAAYAAGVAPARIAAWRRHRRQGPPRVGHPE